MKRLNRKRKIISYIMTMSIIFTMLLSNANAAKAETVYVDRKADVVFVIDATGSMGSYISSVKTNLTNFISTINGEGIDVRVRFVVYRDITCSEETVKSSWYTSSADAIAYLNDVKATGGGDGPETILDGIGQLFTSDFGYRTDAAKFCISLTDASTKMDNTLGYTCEEEVTNKLIENAINSSIITRTAHFDTYENFVSKDGGVLADIAGDYSVVLKKLADTVINGVDNMVIHEIYPTEGLVNQANKVSVRATGLNFDSEFKVTLGGEDVTDLKKTDTGFEFTTPTDLDLGSYDICVTNGTGETPKTIGQYTYVSENSDIGYKVLKIEPATGKAGEEVLVKVTVDKITYKDDFSVTVGGKTAEVQHKESDYFTFKVPITLNGGTYDIVATNGTDKKIGKFVVTSSGSSSSSLLVITDIVNNKTKEGTAVTVSVFYTGTLSDTYSITVGDKEADLGEKTSSKFKFTPSTDLTAGVYDIVLTNGGVIQKIGKFTVTAKAPVKPFIVTDVVNNRTKEGKTATVSVFYTGTLPDDYSITVGGKDAALGEKTSSKFKFTPSIDLTADVYDIILTYDGEEKTIGKFTVTGNPGPVLVITDVVNNKTKEGSTAEVSVFYTGTLNDGYTVIVGGEEADLGEKTSSKFKFTPSVDLAAGEYDMVLTTKEGKTQTIGKFTVTGNPIKPLIITDVVNNKTKEGGKAEVSVFYTGTLNNGYKVEVGGEEADLGEKTSSKFKFTPSVDLAEGVYDIVLTTKEGKTQTIGKFTVTAKDPVKPIAITDIVNNKTKEGTAVTVTAFYTGTLNNGYKVTVGGKNAPSVEKTNNKFRFTPSADLAAGEYDMVLTTKEGKTQTIGKFTVTAKKPVKPLVITDVVNTKAKAGKTAVVSVFYTGTLADGSYTVTVGGQAATLGKKIKTKFQFTSPSKLAVGKHDIILTTGGVSKKIGTFTVTA